MDTVVWLLELYARYFAAVFGIGTVIFAVLWLVSLRSHRRTSPESKGTAAA